MLRIVENFLCFVPESSENPWFCTMDIEKNPVEGWLRVRGERIWPMEQAEKPSIPEKEIGGKVPYYFLFRPQEV